jgi:hypothetical protein
MSNYYAKQELVQNRQLKVQELAIPLTITGNATPASVVVASDEPSIMFLKTEGVNKITAALDSGETAPTFVSQVDASGLFSVMLKIGEPIGKVLSAQLITRNGHTAGSAKLANTSGISANGDKICLDCDTAADLSAASLDACLVVKYIIAE